MIIHNLYCYPAHWRLDSLCVDSVFVNFSRLCISLDLSVHGKIDPSGAKSALGVRVNS